MRKSCYQSQKLFKWSSRLANWSEVILRIIRKKYQKPDLYLFKVPFSAYLLAVTNGQHYYSRHRPYLRWRLVKTNIQVCSCSIIIFIFLFITRLLLYVYIIYTFLTVLWWLTLSHPMWRNIGPIPFHLSMLCFLLISHKIISQCYAFAHF